MTMKSNCVICNKEIDITLCCDGKDCGCRGLPIEPPVCSRKCYDKFMLESENDSRELN